MTLLPCAGVLCPLLSDPLTWQLHGVLKHLAQQAMSNNCCYKHVTKNLKSHTENSKNSKPCRKEKKKNTAQRLTLKLPQGKTSSQTCMADLNSHSLLCQQQEALAEQTTAHLFVWANSDFLKSGWAEQGVLLRLSSTCRTGSTEIWAVSFQSKRSLPFVSRRKMRTQNCKQGKSFPQCLGV